MSGQELYQEFFNFQLNENSIEIDKWDDLEELDQAAWNHIAFVRNSQGE